MLVYIIEGMENEYSMECLTVLAGSKGKLLGGRKTRHCV
jgi:hypothetical protein